MKLSTSRPRNMHQRFTLDTEVVLECLVRGTRCSRSTRAIAAASTLQCTDGAEGEQAAPRLARSRTLARCVKLEAEAVNVN